MLRRIPTFVVLVWVLLCAHSIAKEKTSEEKGKKDELTLEKLFPEKSFFGPSAKSTAFSFDGKYAAYLYRTYEERRHGSDLWIYDVAKGKNRRITSVSVMAKFQQSTRKVKQDRIERRRKPRNKNSHHRKTRKRARQKKKERRKPDK